jgi:hypothetical protein
MSQEFSGISPGRGVRDKLSTMKVCVLARIIVVPVGVAVLLGLCNPPHRGVNSRPNLGRSDECTPYCEFLTVVNFTWGHEAE